MLGKFLTASAALVLGVTAAQANYYAQPMAQPMMAQPMMAQPMMAQPMMAQPMMAQPMMMAPQQPVISPTIVVNNANNNTQQQSNQNAPSGQSNQVSSMNQFGSRRTLDQIYQQCGIGGLIAGQSSPFLASITNITWDWGTTATSSDSASPHMCIQPNVRAALFIKESINDLEVDLVLGRGEHLTALTTLMGCNTAAQNLRTEYAVYTKSVAYTNATTTAKSEQLFKIVDQNLASSTCRA